MSKANRLNEKARAERLAHDLDYRLQNQAYTEQIAMEDRPLLFLAEALSGQNPLAATNMERAQLRKTFDQAKGSRTRPWKPLPFFRFLKPTAQMTLWAVLLVGVFAITMVLVSNLVGMPPNPVAGPAPTTTVLLQPTSTGTSEPTSVLSTPEALATRSPFVVKSQTVNNIHIELRDLVSIGSSLRATLCYQPPDDRDWRLEEVTLNTLQGEDPFYPSSTDQPQPGTDGMACETFTAAMPKDSRVESMDISVKRLIALRQTTPDCAQINQQLAQDYPGMALRCDFPGSGFGWTVEKTPEGMSTAMVFRVEQTYLEYDVSSGPWSFHALPTEVSPLISADQPANPVVVLAACGDASQLAADPQFKNGPTGIPAGIAGMGTYQSGPFTFTIALACDPNFSRLKVAGDEDSEINGLGIFYAIRYEGDGSIEKVEYFDGVSPFILHSGGGSSMRRGDLMSSWEGLRFPDNAKPDFHQEDVQLRYQVKVRTGDGTIEGAALVFTLQREPEGYRPIHVSVEPLTKAERKTVESDLNALAPYPTLPAAVAQVSTDNQALIGLLDRWQKPLRASPGWIHMRTRVDMPRGNDLYAGLTAYTNDDWFQIDDQANVVTMIHIDRRIDGTPLQQVVSQNGKSINLTFGGDSEFKPYPLDLAYAVKDTLKMGDQVKYHQTTVNGQPVILLMLSGMVTRRDAINADTGAWLYTETVSLQPGDDPINGGSLDTRATLEIAERVDTPPAEALALLSREFSGYNAPAPYGTPAPQGFDPSQRQLTLHSVPGDSFNSATFWYGDIYVSGEDYLLGRVDFGAVPSGFCDRSADGLKLAFNYLKTDPSSNLSRSSLRWFDLRSIQTIHQPAPELVNLGVLSWSTKRETLAVFGCKADQKDCGLYLLDPATDQVRLLLPDVYASWQPVWNPDGSQVAFVDTLKEGHTLYVVDIQIGQVIYQGKFDADGWQVPTNSPTIAWGVTFSRDASGSRCFEGK